MIQLKKVSFYYENHYLFRDFSFQFPPHEWTGLLGASGIGKTSLLRLIAHLPSGGQLSENSEIIVPKNQVAYLSQQDSLLPWLSVIDNALLGYRLRSENIQSIRARAIQLLTQVGLGNDLEKKPSALSGGMKQRVALIRTFLENRPIVLLDEPFSALDVITRLSLQNLAVDLLKNKTVVLVTHDPLEALRLSNSVYVLSGSPAILSDPIQPSGSTPRDINDPLLLSLQTKLISQLENCTSTMSLRPYKQETS